jgi:acetylornithine deacetylase/succinyl-diaminopimelate desuccinylase-like protein
MADEYARVGDLLSAARIFAHAMLELGNLPPNG